MMPKKIWRAYLFAAFAPVLLCVPAWSELDKTKYITMDEVRTDMEAYCLTVWYGTKIERFPLKILSVVRNRLPGDDMILVIGTDERFKNSSAVHGCSGSPVFIDNRLAGALAAGWDGSLDPLYLVRPIEDMLQVGTVPAIPTGNPLARPIFMEEIDLLDLTGISEQSSQALAKSHHSGGIPLLLSTSLPVSVCRSLADSFGQLGFSAMPGGMTTAAENAEELNVPLERGSMLAAVLCSGDINLAASGTVTEVVGDTVYGFGHSFTSAGPVEFPMAAGKVHTVVASRESSFKFSSPGPILGTIQFDQNAAIRGQIGVMPTMVPMRITVSRFNDPEIRTYNCRLAYDRNYTPQIAQMVAGAAALMQGDLPPEHALRYTGSIGIKDNSPIRFANISSGRSAAELRSELQSTLDLLLNNPFKQIAPEGIEIEISIEPQDRVAAIWSAVLSQTTVKPGQTITAEITLQSFRAARSVCSVDIKIPETMPPGKYPLQLFGVAAYKNFVSQNAPQRFRVVDADSLLDGLTRVLNVPRNRLYAVLPVPATGLTFRRHELPDLPPTRMLLLQDAKRLEPIEPYKNWVENSVELDKIVSGSAQIEITVEQL
jgi:hypothetical protein